MKTLSIPAMGCILAVMLAVQQEGLWSNSKVEVFAGPPPSKRPALQQLSINTNRQDTARPTQKVQTTPTRPTQPTAIRAAAVSPATPLNRAASVSPAIPLNMGAAVSPTPVNRGAAVSPSTPVNRGVTESPSTPVNRGVTESPGTPVNSEGSWKRPTCKVILNEVFIGDSVMKDPQFVEIKRFCPRGAAQPKLNSLNGYFIISISLTENPFINVVVDLKDENFEDITETLNGQAVINKFYTLGSPQEHLVSGLKLGSVPLSSAVRFQYSEYPSPTTAFPSEEDTLNVVALAYLPKTQRAAFRQAFTLPRTVQLGDHKIGNLQLTPARLNDLKGRIVDLVIYGKDFNDKSEDLLRLLLEDGDYDLQNHIQTMRPSTNILKITKSYSRCTPEETLASAFQFASRTALRENTCLPPKPKHVVFKPHDFKGVEKYLVLNLVESLKNAGTSADVFLGNPIAVAANLLGLNTKTVRKFVTQAQTCDVASNQQRNRKKYVRELIDSFDRDVIRTFISECYRKGIAPLFKEIYKTFLAYKNEECTYTTSSSMTGMQQFLPLCTNMPGESNPTPEPVVVQHIVTPDEFKCSSTTFSKVLDETWVDPHIKFGHGWQLRRPQNIAEQLRYTFKNIKISSGPRLIVLAAGDEDGIIKESVKVRRIDAANVRDDYHKNVDHNEFIEWFKQLLDYYDAKKEKHLIVMDNAPYHSTQIAPKQKERKAVLEAWLNKLRQDPGVQVQVPNTAGMRKWELWEEVSKLKTNPQLQDEVYEIDKLAKSRGHQVMRLPPYHCMFNPIEFTWSDTKSEIAKLNVDQSIDTVAKLVHDTLINYDANKWKRHVGHTRSLLDKYWQQDGFMENENVTKLIVPLNQFDDDEEVEDACSSDDADICEPWYDFDPIEAEADLASGREEVAAWMASLPPAPAYAARGKRKYYCGGDFS